MKRMMLRLRRGFKRASDALVGKLAITVLGGLRLIDANKMADFAGGLMRAIGPLLPENRIGRANLAAAFPEKSKIEIDTILRGCWDNLGRMGAEFAHLDRLWYFDPQQSPERSRIELAQPDIDRFLRLLNDGKPALIFAAHLANWELPAVCAATYKLDSAVLYRRPNISGIDRWLAETRTASMGEMISTDLYAPVKISEALERGAHVGMLVVPWQTRFWLGSCAISIAQSMAPVLYAWRTTAFAPSSLMKSSQFSMRTEKSMSLAPCRSSHR